MKKTMIGLFLLASAVMVGAQPRRTTAPRPTPCPCCASHCGPWSAAGDIQGYLQAAQHAVDQGRVIGENALMAEGCYRESAALAQLALARAHRAGWNREECRALEELVATYAGQRDYAAVADLLRQGALRQTNNPYDVAVEGPGFFCLRAPGGETLYTRCGRFQYDVKTTDLVDGEGDRLGLRIAKDMTNIEVDADGRVRGTRMNGDGKPEVVGQIRLATFLNNAALQRVRGRLYRATARAGRRTVAIPGTNGCGSLAQGHLEESWMGPAPPVDRAGVFGLPSRKRSSPR